VLSRRVHTIGEKVHDAHYAHEKSFSKQVNRSGEEPFVSQHQKYSEAQKHRELRQRLVREGIARPEQEVIPDALPISIQQLDGPMENVAFRLGSAKTGYWISVLCATEATRGVHVRGVRIELPFPGCHFNLLPDPGLSSPIYNFPRSAGTVFPRATVINHKIPGVLHREQPWEGFLAGTCDRPLPEDVGPELTVKVVLYDDLGKAATSDFSVIVNHTTWASDERLNKVRTLGLFEPEEGQSYRPPEWARKQEGDSVPKSERRSKPK